MLGDHDALVAGELVPTPLTRALAVGDRALWSLPPGLSLPPGASAGALASPDGPPDPGLVDALLRQALAGPTVKVPADPARRELSFAEVLSAWRGGARAPPGAAAAAPARLRARRRPPAAPDRARPRAPRRRLGRPGRPDQPAWLAAPAGGAPARAG